MGPETDTSFQETIPGNRSTHAQMFTVGHNLLIHHRAESSGAQTLTSLGWSSILIANQREGTPIKVTVNWRPSGQISMYLCGAIAV